MGFHSPQQLRNTEQLRRTYSIQLSKNSEIYSSHQGAINYLDIDKTEGRYLLSGGADALICIFDIEKPIKNKEYKLNGHKIAPLARISK